MKITATDSHDDRHRPTHTSQFVEGLQAEAELLRSKVRELQRELQGEIQRRDRLVMLGEATGYLAHEMNNLLTPMLGQCEVAQSQAENLAAQQKAVQRAWVQGTQMAKVMDAILTMARPGGAKQARREPAMFHVEHSNQGDRGLSDVRVCIDRALLCIGRDVGQRGVVLGIDVPEGVVVEADATLLQQVLMNVVLNALEAMSKDGDGKGRLGCKRIMISAKSSGGGSSAKGSHVKLTISDSGPGFGLSVVKEQDAGADGLGLRFCRDVVAAAGGSMVICPEGKDGGTRVEISLKRVVLSKKKAA